MLNKGKLQEKRREAAAEAAAAAVADAAKAAELLEEERIPEEAKTELEEVEKRDAAKRKELGINYELEEGEEDDVYAPGPSKKARDGAKGGSGCVYDASAPPKSISSVLTAFASKQRTSSACTLQEAAVTSPPLRRRAAYPCHR